MGARAVPRVCCRACGCERSAEYEPVEKGVACECGRSTGPVGSESEAWAEWGRINPTEDDMTALVQLHNCHPDGQPSGWIQAPLGPAQDLVGQPGWRVARFTFWEELTA